MTVACALPEEYLEALLMRYYTGLECEEIASVLDVSPMQAACNVTRAETLLKECVEKVLEKKLAYRPSLRAVNPC